MAPHLIITQSISGHHGGTRILAKSFQTRQTNKHVGVVYQFTGNSRNQYWQYNVIPLLILWTSPQTQTMFLLLQNRLAKKKANFSTALPQKRDALFLFYVNRR